MCVRAALEFNTVFLQNPEAHWMKIALDDKVSRSDNDLLRKQFVSNSLPKWQVKNAQ